MEEVMNNQVRYLLRCLHRVFMNKKGDQYQQTYRCFKIFFPQCIGHIMILRLKAVFMLPFESDHEDGRCVQTLTFRLWLLTKRVHSVVSSKKLVIIQVLHLLKNLDAFAVS